MAKVDISSIVKAAQSLYGKDARGAAMLGTGNVLRRPTKPEEFVVAPEDHVWREVTGLLGLPFDSIVQIAGAHDSGKSTLAGEFMAFAQSQGCYVILADSEKKFDKIRFEKHFKGDASQLAIIQSTMIRKLAGGMLKYVKSIKEVDPQGKILLVHDSVGGSVSRSRLEHDIDDDKSNQPGSEAVENSD